MSKRLKGILFGIISICLIILIALWFYDPEFKHIEDTNGSEDYSLTTITDRNIIKLNSGPLYELNDDKINDSKISFSKFSGVMQIYEKDCNNENLQINLKNLKINEGNLQVVLLVDNEIVYKFKSNESNQTYKLEKVSGYVAVRIAGESANFEMEYYVE